MIVAIHQTHFLPWLGYFERMRRADVFILLDHVQFERQNYQNRVRIKTGQGPQWITVPVRQLSQKERIADKRIDNGQGPWGWNQRVGRSLQFAYRGAPFFEQYGPALNAVIEARWERLVELNEALIEVIRGALGITTPLVRSSDLDIPGQKNDMIVGLVKAVGGDTFLAGDGGTRGYLDEEHFRRNGLKVAWQNFSHPRYVQHPRPQDFVEGLSAVDLLFNCGPEGRILLDKNGSEGASALEGAD